MEIVFKGFTYMIIIQSAYIFRHDEKYANNEMRALLEWFLSASLIASLALRR